MKGMQLVLTAVGGFSLWALLIAASPAKAPASAAAAGPKVKTVTLEVRHRVFHDFVEKDEVRMNAEQPVGDTGYTFRVTRFVPDFAMAMDSHRIISRSPEPRNPAFMIIVKLKGKAQDTTWAMPKMPPHFARKSLLAFKVMRIDFADHAPVINPDTTSLPVEGAKP